MRRERNVAWLYRNRDLEVAIPDLQMKFVTGVI
jgi:hypothetical protein